MRSSWQYSLGAILLIALLSGAAFVTRDRWKDWFARPSVEPQTRDQEPAAEEAKVLKLSPQARKNLGLVSKPLAAQTYWRTIEVPGVVIDRPGHSDRGVSAPAVSIVTKILAFPGDIVKPGDKLFTLRLFSEYLQNSQSELFKTTREIQLVKEQHARLEGLAKSGAVPEMKLIELDAQLKRFTSAYQAYRQDLLTRGLKAEQINGISEGKFVSEIEVVAPPALQDAKAIGVKGISLPYGYEVQELKVELGQQVNAGELLCLLAHHHSLYIEGLSFKREAPFLEEAAQKAWPVRVEFAEDEKSPWPRVEQRFFIHHLANSVDPVTRTFAFYLPLDNQYRTYEKEGRTFLAWRFRPGQRVQLFVPVEEMTDALVLPASAVVREGPEAFVFRQNGDLFVRQPVHVLAEDREFVTLANDGSIRPKVDYVAQSAAATLNRVLKAQAASGMAAGMHVHPDGTAHGAH